MLNQKVATSLLSIGSLDEAVIIQKNNVRHLVNRISVDLFADTNNEDIVLFPCGIDQNTMHDIKIVTKDRILTVQDGKGVTRPRLLPYLKGMPAAVLSNQCTMHKIVNGTRASMYGVIAHPKGKLCGLQLV